MFTSLIANEDQVLFCLPQSFKYSEYSNWLVNFVGRLVRNPPVTIPRQFANTIHVQNIQTSYNTPIPISLDTLSKHSIVCLLVFKKKKKHTHTEKVLTLPSSLNIFQTLPLQTNQQLAFTKGHVPITINIKVFRKMVLVSSTQGI